MMKKKFFALFGACIILVSCSTGDGISAAILQMFGGSSQALLFLGCRAVSEYEIEFEFSQPVEVKYLNFEPELSVAGIENGRVVTVRLDESIRPGISITADLLAEDENRNTINVLMPFKSRNNRMPALVINEIRTEYSNPRAEFIEFRMTSAGNLGAMRVVILGNTNAANKTIYEFSPIEVKSDEYLTLHLRTVEAGSGNEYGTNLALSGGRDSSPTGRDIWIPGNSKLIHRTSVVYVLDQDDKVLAAVMMSETPNDRWTRETFEQAAVFLHSQGAWTAPDGSICTPDNAIRTAGTTNTRTINRYEARANTNTAADWYITITGGTTPGSRNNPNRYSN